LAGQVKPALSTVEIDVDAQIAHLLGRRPEIGQLPGIGGLVAMFEKGGASAILGQVIQLAVARLLVFADQGKVLEHAIGILHEPELELTGREPTNRDRLQLPELDAISPLRFERFEDRSAKIHVALAGRPECIGAAQVGAAISIQAQRLLVGPVDPINRTATSTEPRRQAQAQHSALSDAHSILPQVNFVSIRHERADEADVTPVQSPGCKPCAAEAIIPFLLLHSSRFRIFPARPTS
jgi:hypothetical protein